MDVATADGDPLADEVEVRDTPPAAAPLGNLRSARLIFTSGVSTLTIDAEPAPKNLFELRSDFRHDVQVEDGTVKIAFRKFGVFDMFRSWRPPRSSIALNPAIPWTIELHSTAAELQADLRSLTLLSFTIQGLVDGATLKLSHPTGTVPIMLRHGAANLTITRPPGVPLRLRVGGKTADLQLDDTPLTASFLKHTWETQDYDRTSNRYNVEIAHGATAIHIEVA